MPCGYNHDSFRGLPPGSVCANFDGYHLDGADEFFRHLQIFVRMMHMNGSAVLRLRRLARCTGYFTFAIAPVINVAIEGAFGSLIADFHSSSMVTIVDNGFDLLAECFEVFLRGNASKLSIFAVPYGAADKPAFGVRNGWERLVLAMSY